MKIIIPGGLNILFRFKSFLMKLLQAFELDAGPSF